MRRRYIAEKYTDEEMANILAGKCWCGKTRDQFDQGMRVYCTPTHRQIWSSKICTWGEFRNEYLRDHGSFCDSCGVRDETDEETGARWSSFIAEFRKIHPEAVKNCQLIELHKAEKRFEEAKVRILQDDSVSEYDIECYLERHKIEHPPRYRDRKLTTHDYQVDHKVAIVNGGEEFSKDNLQVLCVPCHAKKTASDLALRNELASMPSSGARP